MLEFPGVICHNRAERFTFSMKRTLFVALTLLAAQSVYAGFEVEKGVNYLVGEATVTADSLPTLVNAALSVGTYHGEATMTLKADKTVLELPNALFIGGIGYNLQGEPAHQGTVVLEQGTELRVGKETQSSGGHHIDVGNSAAGADGFLQVNGGTVYAGQLVIGNHTNSSGRVEVSDRGSVALSRDGFSDATQIGLVIGNDGGAGTLIVDNASFTDTTGGQTTLGLTGTATVELKNGARWNAAESDMFLGDYQYGTEPLVGAEEHPTGLAAPLPTRPTVESGTQADNGSGTGKDTLSLSGNSALTAKSLALLANADVTVSADSSITIDPTNGGLWVYAGCTLTNDGRLDAYTGVYGGTLQGCGTMSTTIIQQEGKLIVGNSPGRQTYTGKLTVEGSVEFSVDDLLYGVPATAETAGWGHNSYSTIDMGENQLFLNGCVTLTLGEVAMGQLNDSGHFELVLVENIGNADAYTESLLASLLGQTRFADIDGELVSMNTPLLTGTHYEKRGNNLVLTNNPTTPEPATATLSLLALAALASRRRRK